MNAKEMKERSVEEGGGVAPFVRKTYEMVDDVSTESMVSWSQLNNSFVVWDVPQFANLLLPKFFKHSNFSSFVRQLNTYGFRKVDSDRWEFANEGFLRGQKHLLKSINRRKPVQAVAHTKPNSQDLSNCVELGNFELEEDVERLKRDKNILVHQLVRFKKQQQTTDNQLQSVGQRVQVMEQRQQQMMSFLAKEMQSPVFLSQLVRRQNEGNRHIAEIGKKRRLPNYGEDNVGVECDDGRIVKYQPLINEAAKSMLEQILKLNGPPKDPNAFLIDHVPDAYHVVDSVSCSDHSINRTPGSNIRFPEGADLVKESQTPQICLHDSQDDAKSSECSQTLGVTLDNSVNFPDVPLSGARDSNVSLNDSYSVVKNGNDSSDADFDVLLPGSNDKFWEQFFPISPLCEDAEEVDSSAYDVDIDRECQSGQHEEWESHHHVKHLTEQMGLLTSKTERV